MEKFTNVELSRITHSLGVNFHKAIMSHNKKDKQLPKNNDDFYRNYYQVESCDVLDKLVIDGFATKRKALSQNVYHITDLGIDKFRIEFELLVNYKPRKERDLEYLKHRINTYSTVLCNYRFGDDNSEHIFSAYVNYKLNGFYMSHTTTDCVNTFIRELKANKEVLIHFYQKVKA